MSERFRRRCAPIALGFVLALALIGSPSVRPVAAADQLREEIATTYRIDPARHVVHATLDIALTNLHPNTSRFIYWYDKFTLGVQGEATRFVAMSSGSRLKVDVSGSGRTHQVLIHFPNLYHLKTRHIRLTFDLPGAAPRSTSLVRVAPGHVQFLAWGWGDDGLGSVTIVDPPLYDATVVEEATDAGGQLKAPQGSGDVWVTGRLGQPNVWYAVFTADRSALLSNASISLPVGDVHIESWPGDGAWVEHISKTLKQSVPALSSHIGLPWPVDGPLTVTEVASSRIDGYAGVYDEFQHSISLTEEFDDHVIVHEVSHAWFNGRLFADRWVDEGLADTYAAMIVAERDGKEPAKPDVVLRTDPAAFPLDAWPPPSRIDSTTSPAEDYGYSASWQLMRNLLADISEDGVRKVFAAARGRTIAYVGSGSAEVTTVGVDWRRFLDYLDELGHAQKADDLFKTWVASPADAKEFETRAAARATYAALVTHGDAWLPGMVVRDPMSRWHFEDATKSMAAAEAVLVDRDGLVATDSRLGLQVPADLETSYESARTNVDLTSLESEVKAWSDAATHLERARTQVGPSENPLTVLGLSGAAESPAALLDDAAAAYDAGDRSGATQKADAAVAEFTGAAEVGRQRALSAATTALGVSVLLLAVVLIGLRLAARRRRRAAVASATLAATSAPLEAAQPMPEADQGAGSD